MLAKVFSGAVYGVDAYTVEIEVNSGHGEPKTLIVGLPDAAVKESEHRVNTALINSGFLPPKGRVTINLAPANIKKEGPSFDLPIALGMLAASARLPVVVGEAFLLGRLHAGAVVSREFWDLHNASVAAIWNLSDGSGFLMPSRRPTSLASPASAARWATA